MPFNKNIKIISNNKQGEGRGLFLTKMLGPLVFLLLSYFIYLQVIHQPNWKGSLDRVYHAVTGPMQWKLWLVVALMPLNWGIEARKWQLALRPIGGMPYRDAFRAIFTGVTMGSFTPNRMGEYLGRLLYVKEGKRLESISLTIVCSIAQLLTTLVMGLGGLVYLKVNWQHQAAPGQALDIWLNTLMALVIFLLLSLTFVYFRLSRVLWLLQFLRRIPRLGKYLAFIKVLQNFDATILLRILFLSFGRYIVFMIQYCLVFPVFGVVLTIGQAWSGVSVVFLVMAVVPTFTFLTELGLRWGASIRVLELFSVNGVGIFAASFAIWLVNLIVPALIGSLLILSIKLFKNK